MNNLRKTPWLPDDAVFFLEAFLKQNPNATILEFGSGSSTIWLSKKTKNLYSVEHDKEWHEVVDNLLKTNKECNSVQYFLRDRPYYSICEEFPNEFFDLIIIDGRNRKGCIERSIKLLKRKGFLMLDNSERAYYKSIFPLMDDWKKMVFKQNTPDQEGFYYKGWENTIWQKP